MSTLPTRCWAEINLQALTSNIIQLQKLGPEIMAVVKADAYGHGIENVIPTLQRLGVKDYSVATVAEAAKLRQLPGMSERSIYLMASVLAEETEAVVDLNLIPFATDTNFVRALAESSVKKRTTTSIHIEVDTGIGRAGVPKETAWETLQLWNSIKGVKVSGICTHFTAADSTDPTDSKRQLEQFKHALKEVPDQQLSCMAVHASNSPAALRLPASGTSLFRPGLLLYGVAPSQQMSTDFPYRPVFSLKSRVLLVRRLPAGTDISYSRTYRLPNDGTIATVGIGYGDGFPRRLSNIGHVLLPDGARAPIRGRVCMDQICVEVPPGSKLEPGDTVTLIGQNSAHSITAGDIAELIDTTPHEITTCLTQRVPRITVKS